MAKAKHTPLPVPRMVEVLSKSREAYSSIIIVFFLIIKKKIIIVFGKACHAGRASKGTTEKARHSSSSRRLRWAGHTILFRFVAETGCEKKIAASCPAFYRKLRGYLVLEKF
jgi:hypothetical protein